MIWTFRDYLDESGGNLIRPWLDSLPLPVGVKIDARIRYLAESRIWPEQYISALRGCPQIFELRVVFGGSQYRPLGCYGLGLRAFTLLVGAIEKGKIPRPILETALARRETVLGDRNRSCEHDFTNSKISGSEEPGGQGLSGPASCGDDILASPSKNTPSQGENGKEPKANS
jgi:hypothetical protein